MLAIREQIHKIKVMEKNTKQLVLSIEQMKHLKVLGCNTSLSSMHYVYMPIPKIKKGE